MRHKSTQFRTFLRINDIPHGWHENFDEGGVLFNRELYQNGKVVEFSEK